MQESKKEIRKKMLALRNVLSKEQVEYKSAIIIDKLINTNEFNLSTTIMCYLDFRNEVITRNFIRYCFLKGKRIAVPSVIRSMYEENEMGAFEITSLDYGLEVSTLGIDEPCKGSCKEVAPEEIDIVIVPGVAFDSSRNRIGYGAGFYDRFLKKVRFNCLKVGIAFELQMVEKIPVCEFDLPMDIIITEERVI